MTRVASSRMNSLGRGFTALRHRNYMVFWWGQLISLIGTWMQTTAQAWLVLELTGSAADLGIVSALQALPVLVIGLFGGLVADWMPKRRLLVITQTTQMLLALVLGLLVSTHVVQMWHIYVLAGLLGVSNAFDMPTRQAFVVEMVGRDDLMNAVALGSMQFNAARIVGPAIAGLSIALIGVTGSFYANAASFIAVIAGLFLMRPADFFEVAAAPRTSVLGSLAEGCRYVLRAPVILTITLLVGMLGLFAFNGPVLIPIFAQDILHSGAAGFGGLMAAQGIGALLAALAAAYLQRASWKVILTGAFLLTGFELLFGLSHVYVLSFVLLLVTGYGMVTVFTSANTAVQMEAPNALRGRVMGVYMAINMGSMPIGNLAAGFVAGVFGAAFTMVAGSAVALVLVAAMAVFLYARRAAPAYRIAAPGEVEAELAVAGRSAVPGAAHGSEAAAG
jgi:MFS family permease